MTCGLNQLKANLGDEVRGMKRKKSEAKVCREELNLVNKHAKWHSELWRKEHEKRGDHYDLNWYDNQPGELYQKLEAKEAELASYKPQPPHS